METAESIVNDALQEILVQASEAPIQTVDFNTAVRYMNRFMFALDAKGISLGYTKVSKASDLITIPDGALEGLVFNLAVRLATSYDMPIGQGLYLSAKEGMQAMRDIAVVVEPTPMPCTLPYGSGNDSDSYSIYKFYPCQDDELLNESGGTVILENDTNE